MNGNRWSDDRAGTRRNTAKRARVWKWWGLSSISRQVSLLRLAASLSYGQTLLLSLYLFFWLFGSSYYLPQSHPFLVPRIPPSHLTVNLRKLSIPPPPTTISLQSFFLLSWVTTNYPLMESTLVNEPSWTILSGN